MSLLLSPSSIGEISQHRHGSFPQFPSILIISTLEGSGIRINVSKSDDFELHPPSNEDPDRNKRSIRDNPSPERMLTSCRLTPRSAAGGGDSVVRGIDHVDPASSASEGVNRRRKTTILSMRRGGIILDGAHRSAIAATAL